MFIPTGSPCRRARDVSWGCGAIHITQRQGRVYNSVSEWNWNHPNQNDMCVGIRASFFDSSAVLIRNSSVTCLLNPCQCLSYQYSRWPNY